VVIVGLLLMVVAAGFTVDVFAQNTDRVDVDVLGRTFAVAPGWIVVAGIAALVVFVIGARVIGAGITRARRRRTTLRTAHLAGEERDRLAQQLASERAAHERSQPAANGDDAGAAESPAAPDAVRLDH